MSIPHFQSSDSYLIYMILSGVSKQLVAILLGVAGGVEIPSRTFNGWLADRKFVSAYKQLAFCMLVTGICACLCGIISGVAGKFCCLRSVHKRTLESSSHLFSSEIMSRQLPFFLIH